MCDADIKRNLHFFGYDGKFKVNINGEVDVYGDLFLNQRGFSEIPIKFGKVKNFWCSNSDITTLKNSPREVDGFFVVNGCKITSLDYSPIYVKHMFFISKNPIVNNLDEVDSDCFLHWDKLDWFDIISENPKLINFAKKYMNVGILKNVLNSHPQTKLYLE